MPRRWVVLALVLALMALVVAVSSAPGIVGHRSRPSRATGDSHGRTGTATAPTASSRSLALAPSAAGEGPHSPGPPATLPTPTASGGPALEADAGPGALAAATSGSPSAASAGPPRPTVTALPSDPPPASTAADGSGTVGMPPAGGGAGVSSEPEPGNLQYPDDVSAQYEYEAGAAGLQATAEWAGSTLLSLTVQCPGGEQARSGGSGIEVQVGGPAGDCTVTLAEPTDEEATISYTLTVEQPAP